MIFSLSLRAQPFTLGCAYDSLNSFSKEQAEQVDYMYFNSSQYSHVRSAKLRGCGPVIMHFRARHYEEFENKGLVLRLGLSYALIRQENGAFQKRSSNWENLKTPAFRNLVPRVSHLTAWGER